MSGSQYVVEETYQSGPIVTTETYSSSGPIVTYNTSQGIVDGSISHYQSSKTGPSFAKNQQYSVTAHGSHGSHVVGGSQMVTMNRRSSHTTGPLVVSHAGTESRTISVVRGEARETGESHVVATRAGEARFTGEVNVVSQRMNHPTLVGTQIVGHERGAETQLSVTEHHMGDEVIGEKTSVVGRGKKGRKVIREEVIEKVIVVPETIQIEEWVEDDYEVEETVIDVAKKYQIEKTVEVAEIEIVEKIVEQIETIVREKVIEVPKIETVERIVEVPVIQTVEKVVEVPEIQYNDVPVEKIVEVPEYHTEEIIREVKSANFVEKPIEQKRLVADSRAHARKLPVPVEAETIIEFCVPALRANYLKKKFPVYLPRFIEVPVSRQFVDAGIAGQNEKYAARLHNLMTAGHAVSLCEIEKLASEYKDFENRNRLTQKKIAVGAQMDEHTKRTMFGQVGVSWEQHALYKMLPVEISDLHIGRYNYSGLGSCITYNSSQFHTGGHMAITHSGSTGGHATITHSGSTRALTGSLTAGSLTGGVRVSASTRYQ